MKRRFGSFMSMYKYANFDFHQLKNEILDLLQSGRRNGLNNPDYCRLLIENSQKGYDYPIEIELYYCEGDNVKVLPKKLIIGHFSSIPSQIKNRLIMEGRIIIRVENLLGLALSINEKIEMPTSFNSVTSSKSRTNAITIEDELFDYCVRYEMIENGQVVNTKVIRYADIIGMPSDIMQILTDEGSYSLNI